MVTLTACSSGVNCKAGTTAIIKNFTHHRQMTWLKRWTGARGWAGGVRVWLSQLARWV